MNKVKKSMMVITACVLIGAILLAIGLMMSRKEKPVLESGTNIFVTDDKGNALQPGESYGLCNLRYLYSIEQDETAEIGITLEVSLEPANVDDTYIYWSVEFVEPDSPWAAGKEVTDYVTIEPAEEGALTAVIKCWKDFGAQIQIVVSPRDNPLLNAKCTVDFVKRVEKFSYQIVAGDTYTLNEEETPVSGQINMNALFLGAQFLGGITYSDYTVDRTFDAAVTFTLSETFSNKLQSETGEWVIANGGYTLDEELAFGGKFQFSIEKMWESWFPALTNDNTTAERLKKIADETTEDFTIKVSFYSETDEYRQEYLFRGGELATATFKIKVTGITLNQSESRF